MSNLPEPGSMGNCGGNVCTTGRISCCINGWQKCSYRFYHKDYLHPSLKGQRSQSHQVKAIDKLH
nr:hypothetical protein [Escherichia coli]